MEWWPLIKDILAVIGGLSIAVCLAVGSILWKTSNNVDDDEY